MDPTGQKNCKIFTNFSLYEFLARECGVKNNELYRPKQLQNFLPFLENSCPLQSLVYSSVTFLWRTPRGHVGTAQAGENFGIFEISWAFGTDNDPLLSERESR
jgi:hypothetical protein